MDGYAHFPRVGALFAEDFDAPRLPEAIPEPEPVEPVFSDEELALAREAAWREGHAAGVQQADADSRAMVQRAMAAIAEQMAAERGAAMASAEQCAEAIAHLLLDSLAAAFPVLCARYGDNEVAGLIRAVLPALTQEPAITVRAHPGTLRTVTAELEGMDPDIAGRVQTIECDSMAPGDVRVAWRNGACTRDATGLWRQVVAVLAPAGLLRADTAIMETIDGG